MKILETRRIIAILIVLTAVFIGVGYNYFKGQGFPDKKNNDTELILTRNVELSQEHDIYIKNRLSLTKAGIKAKEEAGEPDMRLYQELASDAYFLGDLQLAKEAYIKYLELNNINDAMWSSYGAVLEKMNDFAGAEDAYKQAIGLDQKREAYWNNLIGVQKKLDYSYEQLSETYTQAISAVGQTKLLIVDFARLHLENKNCEQAFAHYKVGMRLDLSDDGLKQEYRQAQQDCKK